MSDNITDQFVTFYVANQLFGIPVLQVCDVLAPQAITPVPLAPHAVAGALNLRGRIVTAMDLRARLDLPPRPGSEQGMNIVVDRNGELYSLIVDKAGEVVGLSLDNYENIPATLDPRWQSVAKGIYRLKDTLLVVLDIVCLLAVEEKAAA